MRRNSANAIRNAAGISASADKGGRMLLSIVIVIAWRVLFGAEGKKEWNELLWELHGEFYRVQSINPHRE
jgi:hypothetical protein